MLAGIIEAAATGSFAAEVAARLLDPLELTTELFVGKLPAAVAATTASISTSFASQAQQLGSEMGGGGAAASTEGSGGFGHELPLSAGMVNAAELRAAVVPGALRHSVLSVVGCIWAMMPCRLARPCDGTRVHRLPGVV